jgi:hypothetical protein
MCWVSRSSGRTTGTEFLVTNLGFQGRFSARLGADLNLCLSSVSPFHNFFYPFAFQTFGTLALFSVLSILLTFHLRD